MSLLTVRLLQKLKEPSPKVFYYQINKGQVAWGLIFFKLLNIFFLNVEWVCVISAAIQKQMVPSSNCDFLD